MNCWIKEICRAKCAGKGQRVHALFRHTTLPIPACVHQPISSPNPILLELYRGPSYRHDQSLTSFSALLPSQEIGEWG